MPNAVQNACLCRNSPFPHAKLVFFTNFWCPLHFPKAYFILNTQHTVPPLLWYAVPVYVTETSYQGDFHYTDQQDPLPGGSSTTGDNTGVPLFENTIDPSLLSGTEEATEPFPSQSTYPAPTVETSNAYTDQQDPLLERSSITGDATGVPLLEGTTDSFLSLGTNEVTVSISHELVLSGFFFFNFLIFNFFFFKNIC